MSTRTAKSLLDRADPRGIIRRGSTSKLDMEEGSTRRAAEVQRKPVLELLPSSYQPTRDELEEDIGIDASPEELARRALRPVRLRTKN